jgi:uncharacterized protein (DUF1778 family)
MHRIFTMAHVTPSVLSVRVNPHERALLIAAAGHAQTNLSDFIRRKAIEAAEIELLERTIVTIPSEKWQQFEAWVDAPANEVPALRNLSTARLAWQN